MYPRLVVDLNKLKSNLDAVAKITKDDAQASMMIVTKAVCAAEEIVEMIAKHPKVDYIADARIKNIKTFSKLAKDHGKETVLLRLPMKSEVSEVVKYADISFNSELEVVRLLNDEAKKLNKIHKVVLMIDLGDLREGIFFEHEDKIYETVGEILKLDNIKFEGIGVNLTCYGAIIPKRDNLQHLVDWKDKLESKFDIKLNIVSGGNSSSIYLIGKNELPQGINNLRLGECFFLGNDTAYGSQIEGTIKDAMILEAEIIELKKKPSMPIGEIGKDAFGNVPHYEDKGDIMRAILAIGQQDTTLDSMVPLDEGVEIIGGSSDHTVLDVTNSPKELKVGDVLRFQIEYGALLKATTSKYVEKVYI